MLMIFKEIISNVKYKPCKSLRNAALLPNTINKTEELYICFCILWREDDNDYFTTHRNVINDDFEYLQNKLPLQNPEKVCCIIIIYRRLLIRQF